MTEFDPYYLEIAADLLSSTFWPIAFVIGMMRIAIPMEIALFQWNRAQERYDKEKK